MSQACSVRRSVRCSLAAIPPGALSEVHIVARQSGSPLASTRLHSARLVGVPVPAWLSTLLGCQMNPMACPTSWAIVLPTSCFLLHVYVGWNPLLALSAHSATR